MSQFLGDRYLISSDAGLALYDAVKTLPIVDPHNHADVKQIAENKPFTDIWQLEGATDHYVWELLRKRGVPERLITGDATPREKWLSAAAVWEDFASNPSYEWVHLDLQRYLGIDLLINAENGPAIWDRAQAALQQPENRPQAMLRRMNVEAMCSTDDPIDSLEWHRMLDDSPIAGMIRPTFRPDKAMNIFKPDWLDYIHKLEGRVNSKFRKIDDLIAALRICHDHFAANGCVASDHGVELPYGYQVDITDANDAFRRALKGHELNDDEEIAYMSYVLNEVAQLDAEKGWVFQLHMGAVRDVRDLLAETLGPDTGGDVSDHNLDILESLKPLLNRFDDRLKMVLYCLEPGYQATLATLTRAFGAKVNLGSAWWFNDTPYGMRTQLEYVSGVDLLSSHAGMVSDSRKILSYGSRHEMFRRVLCDVLGRMIDQGRLPHAPAERLATNMCYHNPKKLFGL